VGHGALFVLEVMELLDASGRLLVLVDDCRPLLKHGLLRTLVIHEGRPDPQTRHQEQHGEDQVRALLGAALQIVIREEAELVG
jgi:hypothetical protein